jgi:hypothetical protein
MKSRTFFRIFGSAVGLMLTAALAIQLTGMFSGGKLLAKQTQGYQAVLLDNNQVYYGKLTGLGSDYPVLTDVFYIQTAVNQETKQASNVLLKRGKEWHGPDRMLLSARHIIMIEPVNPGSTVANLIDQASRK